MDIGRGQGMDGDPLQVRTGGQPRSTGSASVVPLPLSLYLRVSVRRPAAPDLPLRWVAPGYRPTALQSA